MPSAISRHTDLSLSASMGGSMNSASCKDVLMNATEKSGTKFDQASLQVERVMKLEDRYLSRVCALFQRIPLPITSRKAS